MKKIFGLIIGSFIELCLTLEAFCADKFDIIPDLPEPLAAAQASSITTNTAENTDALVRSVGSEPNIITLISSLIIVILSIYICARFYTWLKKVGFKVVGQQGGSLDSSRVTVVSTTPLGNNKTLHVVELDGKRMLIGASTNSIDLIKDLGSYPPVDIQDGEYSKIEIPNIRIPKIEIPKIEFPDIGFTKTFKAKTSEEDKIHEQKQNSDTNESSKESNEFVISDIYEESPDGIIDKLFTSVPTATTEDVTVQNKEEEKHIVDPDEYALYKKYL